MYCPNCATPAAATQTRCSSCNLDLEPIIQLLQTDAQAARTQRWKEQRHSLGLFVVMCSLLVGCFIPIAVGILGGSAVLNAVVVVLAGLAGVLLFLGAMLILAGEGKILNSRPPMPSEGGARQVHTGATTPLLDHTPTTVDHSEAARQPIKR